MYQKECSERIDLYVSFFIFEKTRLVLRKNLGEVLDEIYISATSAL